MKYPDIIDGATINLIATTSSDVRLNITNDKSTLETNLRYNGLTHTVMD